MRCATRHSLDVELRARKLNMSDTSRRVTAEEASEEVAHQHALHAAELLGPRGCHLGAHLGQGPGVGVHADTRYNPVTVVSHVFNVQGHRRIVIEKYYILLLDE